MLINGISMHDTSTASSYMEIVWRMSCFLRQLVCSFDKFCVNLIDYLFLFLTMKLIWFCSKISSQRGVVCRERYFYHPNTQIINSSHFSPTSFGQTVIRPAMIRWYIKIYTQIMSSSHFPPISSGLTSMKPAMMRWYIKICIWIIVHGIRPCIYC